MTILYPLYGNLYVNMTNRCPCACTFCLRQNGEELNGSGSFHYQINNYDHGLVLLRKIFKEVGDRAG